MPLLHTEVVNYLAHLVLAGETAESLIGNLAGDFVKGPIADQFTPGIRRGIAAHRAIDAFTDSHPEVNATRKVLTPEFGHYSRVIADVFFDHFLASEWDVLYPETLEAFLTRTWSVFDSYQGVLPGRMGAVYPRMRDEGWLLSYRHTTGIHQALYHLSFRLSRRPHLELATRYLTESHDQLRMHFRRFFPDVQKLAAKVNAEPRQA